MIEALKQAKWAYEHIDTLDKQTRVDYAVALGEWKVFSNRQIAAIVGINHSDIGAYTGKTDRTGGNFSPDSIVHLLEICYARGRGEVDDRHVAWAAETGTSTRMIARLTGLNQSAITRAVRRMRAAAPKEAGLAA